MTIWRPAQSIRVKTLGLAWRDDRLLASEVCGDDGHIKGVRPLGGSVEFGETWQAALIREFQEELGLVVEPVGAPLFLENIYSHEGALGHELIILSDVVWAGDAYRNQDVIAYFEDDGTKCFARWFDIDALDQGDLALYPAGLKEALQARAIQS